MKQCSSVMILLKLDHTDAAFHKSLDTIDIGYVAERRLKVWSKIRK